MGETVGEALERLATAQGVSLSELSRLIGRNLAYLQQFVRRGTPRQLAERDRRLLAQFLGVDETLLGGTPRDEAISVPYLTVAASAGAGLAAGDERAIRQEAFAAQMLRDAGVSPRHASVIDVSGDSMRPTILAGDRLLVDRADTRLARTGIFVVRQGDDLLVKRISRAGAELMLLSDNPDYAPIRCAPGDATVIGRVKLLLRQP